MSARDDRVTPYHHPARRPTGHPLSSAAAAALLGPDELLTRAACKGLSPMFDTDPLPDESHDEQAERLDAAQAVCSACAVRVLCRDLGEREHLGGVWGGVRRPYHPSHVRNRLIAGGAE